ncbi:hypothetical protein AB5J72_35910 [Streptomyces sp. CG1]
MSQLRAEPDSPGERVGDLVVLLTALGLDAVSVKGTPRAVCHS